MPSPLKDTPVRTRRRGVRQMLFVALVANAVLVACGGGDTASDTVTPITVPTPVSSASNTGNTAPTTTATDNRPAPGETVRSLDDAYSAIVRVTARGTFVHPVGLDLPPGEPIAGYGSGFSIGDNIIVTVAQAVVGASEVSISVPGEDTDRIGIVRGVDECGGVAVIDVDGPPLPVLSWYDDDRVRTGLAVFSAGYSAVESSYGAAGAYIQAGGYVDAEASSAATSWSDPGLLVTYSAPAYAGMHGGPLLDAQGRVVAVIGARDRGVFASMNNGLFAGFVVPMLQRLVDGDSVAAGAGINLQAIETDTGLAGMWVAAVHPGSLAEQSGVVAGDLLTTVGDTGAFTFGSPDVSGYCRTLRSAGGAAGVRVELARYGTGDRFTGTFGSSVRQVHTGTGEPGAPYAWVGDDTYASLPTDAFAHIRLDVPLSWNQRRTAPVAVDQLSSSFFLAADNVADFEAGLRTAAGVRARSSAAYRSEAYTTDALMSRVVSEAGLADCTASEDIALDELTFATPIQRIVQYSGCSGDTWYTIAVGQGAAGGFTIEVQTIHAAMHPLALELLERAVIDGQP